MIAKSSLTSFKGLGATVIPLPPGTLRESSAIVVALVFALTNPQKRHLKALAHARKPVVIIGDSGVTPAVLHEILLALDHHELIKVRVNAEDRESRQATIGAICATTEAVLVQRVGHIATLFRRNPEKPRIDLP
jgi:RNA-binding protein